MLIFDNKVMKLYDFQVVSKYVDENMISKIRETKAKTAFIPLAALLCS